VCLALVSDLESCLVTVCSIDATDEQQFGIQGRRLGRLVNHGNTARKLNARMKVLKTDTGPVLCIFAMRNISAGEQILYDYGIPLKDLVCCILLFHWATVCKAVRPLSVCLSVCL